MNIFEKIQGIFTKKRENNLQISNQLDIDDYISAFREVTEKFEDNSEPQAGRMQLIGWDLEYVHGPALAGFIDVLLIRRLNDFIPDNDQPRILDCGANIGFSVLNYKRQFPKARVTAFEPDPTFVPVLRNNLERNRAGDVQVVEAAVWIENGEMAWFSEGIDGSKLLINQEPVGSSLKVKTIDLSDYLTEPVDLLKIDIEGAEYKVLDHIKNDLHNVKNMIVECHTDQTNLVELNQLTTILKQTGFHVTINSMGVWRDLIRQRPVQDFHWEQYFVISAWRTRPSQLPLLDDTVLPFTGIYHLLQLEELRRNLREREEKLLSIIHAAMHQQEIRSYTLTSPFRKTGNLGWITDLPREIPSWDPSQKKNDTMLLLFEDNVLLGPSHSIHDDIRNFGKGRYSHWNSQLYFSSSDGSDPNKNGRIYKIIY